MQLPKLRFSVTRFCQLSCKFCGGMKRTMENFQPKGFLPMKTSEMLKVIRSYIKAGGLYVQFTGGEPLLNKDIFLLIEKTKELGGIPEINTNAIALTAEIARKLRKSGLETLKVSLLGTDKEKYQEVTGVDGFDQVIEAIKQSLPYIYIRVNYVLTRSSFSDLPKLLDLLNSIKIPELLLLELLYYKNVPGVESSKSYFEHEFVDIKKEAKDFLERYQGNMVEEFPIFGIFGTKFYRIKSSSGGTHVVFKQADNTLRVEKCLRCKDYCQEGIYELRVSDGGYLNVCNVVNELGFSILKELKKGTLDEAFEYYKKLFDKTHYSTFLEFTQKNGLDLY